MFICGILLWCAGTLTGMSLDQLQQIRQPLSYKAIKLLINDVKPVLPLYTFDMDQTYVHIKGNRK